MYWVLIFLMVLALILGGGPVRENFQEMFGFSGHRDPISDTTISFGSESYNGYTDVTSEDGVTSDEVNTCVKATMNFINDRLKMCSYPVETNKITKLQKDADMIYKCQFMFMVKSTNYPFMLGVEADVRNGSVIRVATQDMHKPLGGPEVEENFKSFSEVENFKVYSR